MCMLTRWKEWAQKQYDNWGSKLQPIYTRVDNWDTSPWVKNILRDTWELLDAKLQKKLYYIVMDICKNFDDEFAKQFVQKLSELIKKYFVG